MCHWHLASLLSTLRAIMQIGSIVLTALLL